VVINSGLCLGTLRHRRFAPIAHAFTYPLFMALLDIDRLPELMRVSRVTGYNRFNWASFHDRDHLGDPARPLRERLVVDAARHGIDLPDGRIFLLTHLRYLGYGFNPVSFFYCFDAAGRLLSKSLSHDAAALQRHCFTVQHSEALTSLVESDAPEPQEMRAVGRQKLLEKRLDDRGPCRRLRLPGRHLSIPSQLAGYSVVIKGGAFNNFQIADFMDNLRKVGIFADVDFVVTEAERVEQTRVVSFEVTATVKL
jgi:hypothetical protein